MFASNVAAHVDIATADCPVHIGCDIRADTTIESAVCPPRRLLKSE
jgi:hypothetical protein